MLIIGLVRGLPDKEERGAAEGDALPLRAMMTDRGTRRSREICQATKSVHT